MHYDVTVVSHFGISPPPKWIQNFSFLVVIIWYDEIPRIAPSTVPKTLKDIFKFLFNIEYQGQVGAHHVM